MKLFSAQYAYTNAGPLLKRPVIATSDDGTIISVTDTGGNLPESATLAWHNGIIVPGFVNSHCHLELSSFRGLVEPAAGLPGFIESIRRLRETPMGDAGAAATKYDTIMHSEGIVACADICNGTDSFSAKQKSKIDYISLIEVFGINQERARQRFDEALEVARTASNLSLKHNIVPHSAYAISLQLLQMIKEYKNGAPVTSLHFMESEAEAQLLTDSSGALFEAYRQFTPDLSSMNLPLSHANAVLNQITPDGNLILVHNTFADEATVDAVSNRGNLFWCLCPNSNIHITGRIPPAAMLREKGCTIVIGTDSLASNDRLSILSEMITLQEAFPEISLQEIVAWATINGARAIGTENIHGSIEPGKRPGLLLIENCDLSALRLNPGSKIKRLI
jgi:aminodeoxyfutalosine deaminase